MATHRRAAQHSSRRHVASLPGPDMQAHHPFHIALLAAVACCASGAAQGAIVHRCRQADGVIAYRDTGCIAGETPMSQLEFIVPEPAPTPASAAAAPPREAPRNARTANPARSARADGEIVAHECRFGEQRWVQAEACPASLAAASAGGGKAPRQRVEETRLTKSQVCGALRATSAAHSSGAGSARRAYGMNRLRQRHGC